jgi:hypothetical protein
MTPDLDIILLAINVGWLLGICTCVVGQAVVERVRDWRDDRAIERMRRSRVLLPRAVVMRIEHRSRS